MLKRLFLAALLMWPAVTAAQEHTGSTVAVIFDQQSKVPLVEEGLVDRETGRTVTASDPVRIASISKMVTGLAALRLVDEGKLDLDADVSRYLGWPLRSPYFPDAPVTLAQLLSHRSGLRDDAGYVIPLGESLREYLSQPDAWYRDAPPGDAPFEYANLGSPVVATVLEAASGERFDRLVNRTVFAPLGIEACFNWIGCSPEQHAKAVVLYRDNGDIARDDAGDLPPRCTIPVADGVPCTLDGYVPGTNASIFSPQGGLRISMSDLATLGQAILRGPDGGLLSRDAYSDWMASIRTNWGEQDFFCQYGLTIQMIGFGEGECQDALFQDGRVRFGHAGEAYGLRSGLWLDLGNLTGVAYFITAVPDREGAEDEGGFDPREISLMQRVGELSEALRATGRPEK